MRTYNWTPHYCKERLYLDDADVFGLKYWHDDALWVVEQMSPKEKK